VHPLRCKAIASARLKNDKVDAAILAQLLRADLLPEAWIAPQPVRQLRAQLRHRASLVRLGTQLRNRIHAVVADFGYDRAGSYWTGPGRGWLAELDLPPVSREIVTDCLASIDSLAPVGMGVYGAQFTGRGSRWQIAAALVAGDHYSHQRRTGERNTQFGTPTRTDRVSAPSVQIGSRMVSNLRSVIWSCPAARTGYRTRLATGRLRRRKRRR